MKTLTSAEVFTRKFPICGKIGGYDKNEVQEVLDVVAEFISAHEQGQEVDAYDAAQRVRNVSLSSATVEDEGYDRDAVDSYLDKVCNTLISMSLSRRDASSEALKLRLGSSSDNADSGEVGRKVAAGLLVLVSGLAVTAALLFDKLPF